MFVKRNEEGRITAAFTNPQLGEELEFLVDGNEELAAFLESLGGSN